MAPDIQIYRIRQDKWNTTWAKVTSFSSRPFYTNRGSRIQLVFLIYYDKRHENLIRCSARTGRPQQGENMANNPLINAIVSMSAVLHLRNNFKNSMHQMKGETAGQRPALRGGRQSFLRTEHRRPWHTLLWRWRGTCSSYHQHKSLEYRKKMT